jgi:hypothetical protein
LQLFHKIEVPTHNLLATRKRVLASFLTPKYFLVYPQTFFLDPLLFYPLFNLDPLLFYPLFKVHIQVPQVAPAPVGGYGVAGGVTTTTTTTTTPPPVAAAAGGKILYLYWDQSDKAWQVF